MNRKIFAILAIFTAFFVISCETPLEEKKEEKTPQTRYITLSSLTGDGSNNMTTTKLTLLFDKDFSGLAQQNITIEPGSTGASKGNLRSLSNIMFELDLTGITSTGLITVHIVKENYVIEGAPKSITVYYKNSGQGGEGGEGDGDTYNIPEEFQAKWYNTQAAANADTGTGDFEFTSNGDLIFVGNNNGLYKANIEGSTITVYQKQGNTTIFNAIGSAQFTLSGTELNITSSTNGVLPIRIFYKKGGVIIPPEPELIYINFSQIEQDGEEHNYWPLYDDLNKDYEYWQTPTTKLTLRFKDNNNANKDIEGLNINDIEITSLGSDHVILHGTPLTVQKTSIMKDQNIAGTYYLNVTVLPAPGNIKVKVTKNNYNIDNNDKTVKVYGWETVIDASNSLYDYCYGQITQKVTIKSYKGAREGNIVIPNQINGMDVVAIRNDDLEPSYSYVKGAFKCEYAWNNIKSITGITFPNKLIYIGAYAFENHNLSQINLPNSVEYIAERAFSSRTEMKNTDINNLYLSDNIVYIGDLAFENCKINNVRLPENISFNRLYNLVFSGNNNISSIIIPNNIKYLGATFGMSKYLSITMPYNVEFEWQPRPDRYFIDYYNNNGKLAGTYTRPNTESNVWTRQ